MAVSSKRNSEIKKFSKSHEFFDVGEEFLYEALHQPKGYPEEGEILVKAEYTPIPFCSECCLQRYCSDAKNRNDDGMWIPCCSETGRSDHISVIFKKVV